MYDNQAILKGRLHADPQTAAEHFALHLELNYGLQLDTPKSRGLVHELEEFAFRANQTALGFDRNRQTLPYSDPGTAPNEPKPGPQLVGNPGALELDGFNRSNPALPYSDPGLAPGDPRPVRAGDLASDFGSGIAQDGQQPDVPAPLGYCGNTAVEEQDRLACGTPTAADPARFD